MISGIIAILTGIMLIIGQSSPLVQHWVLTASQMFTCACMRRPKRARWIWLDGSCSGDLLAGVG